mgnify:CR=1 FL=1
MGPHVAQFTLDSVGSAGVVAAPTAGATVTWLQAPQNGRYAVQITYGYEPGGIIPGPQTKVNNLRLQVDGTSVSSLTHLGSVSATYAATVILTVTAANWISLNVISPDAGSRYVGGLILSKLG